MLDGMIERIDDGSGNELAIILRSGFSSDGLTFLTPEHYSQQLGYMRHPAGHVVAAHVHHEVERVIHGTMEVLFIRSGQVRVDLFATTLSFSATRLLGEGDIILLVAGGHRFEMLTDSEIVEVKQGPFLGTADKSRFQPVVPPLSDHH